MRAVIKFNRERVVLVVANVMRAGGEVLSSKGGKGGIWIVREVNMDSEK
jgi:hypothetical protein